MANEFTVQFSMSVENGYSKDRVSLGQLQFDQAAGGRGGHEQSIGTSDESLQLGDITTEGFLYLRNLDTTNFVIVGPEIGTTGAMQDLIKLKPGEFAWLRLKPGASIMARADTAAVRCDVRCYED